MAVSESGAIINALREQGLSMESIGQGIGRNRSLVRQVSIGAKPGNNLRDALAELRARVAGLDKPAANAAARPAPEQRQAVAQRARRTTKSGRPAHVRKGLIRGRSWASGTAKRQASRGGAKTLGRLAVEAAEAGMALAVTVDFTSGVTVEQYSAGKRGRSGPGGVLDFKVDPEQFDPDAQTFTEFVVSQAIEAGHLRGMGERDDVSMFASRVDSIEARVFDG